jgi:hypothetical protein
VLPAPALELREVRLTDFAAEFLIDGRSHFALRHFPIETAQTSFDEPEIPKLLSDRHIAICNLFITNCYFTQAKSRTAGTKVLISQILLHLFSVGCTTEAMLYSSSACRNCGASLIRSELAVLYEKRARLTAAIRELELFKQTCSIRSGQAEGRRDFENASGFRNLTTCRNA